MKKYISILFAVLLFAGSCAKYDDTRIKQDLDDVGGILDELEQKAEDLASQMNAVNDLLKSKFITLISTDADGNHVITYMNDDGTTSTVTVATQDDVVTMPIIGIAEDEGEWYWRQTTDNGETWEWIYTDDSKTERYRVGGEMPEVGIDDEGFWTVNGTRLTDKNGNGILANDASNILFRSVTTDEKTGEAVFTLADGSEFRMQMFEALKISFDTPTYTAVPDASTKLKIRYTVEGSLAEGALVDIFTAYNVSASIDTSISTITVSMDGSAAEGNILVMAHSQGSTVLKPLFFTYGSAEIQDPVCNGSTGDIVIEGDLTQFEVSVSASIDYTVSIEEEAQSWLFMDQTRALTTQTYKFTSDAYEDASGAIRSGEIRFANELYDISAAITVKQSPKAPEGTGGGIASAADLMAFAQAVNAGASTTRWENEAGEVVLLNDIDMSAVTEWTPIGGVDGSETNTTDVYKVVNPFKGKFNGQGFAIRNFTYNADMSTGQYGYALFGSIDGATVKDLVLGDPDTEITWTFTGTAVKGTGVASLVVYALNSTVENVTNYYNIDFAGDNSDGEICFAAGIAAAMKNSTLGGSSSKKGCVNNGFVRTGIISNTQNGGSGMQTGGICAFMAKDAGNQIVYCVNYGHVSCPTGRTGGIAGTMMNGNLKNCDNYGLIEDNLAGQPGLNYNNKRMGGLVGGTDDLRTVLTATVESCTNYGNVFSHLGCRTGGFIGHSNVQIIGCVNKGVILSDKSTDHGPGWACGYSGKSTDTWTNVSSCTMGGKVGDFTQYKDNPDSAPDATVDNAFSYKNAEYFDPSINTVN